MEQASPGNKYHYNPKLRKFASELRKRMTKSEACLWKYVLRAGKMRNYTFNRQRPVLNYIADFMCRELLLVIELDGITHELEEVQIKDLKKEKDLEEVGFVVLRFPDREVLNNITNVTRIIEEWVEKREKELVKE